MSFPDIARFSIPTEVHARWFDEELILLNLGKGEYFSLNALGGRIWQELAAGHSVSEAVQRLAVDYDVEPLRFREDLELLVGDLVGRGLVLRISE
jgi:hypothetical protein